MNVSWMAAGGVLALAGSVLLLLPHMLVWRSQGCTVRWLEVSMVLILAVKSWSSLSNSYILFEDKFGACSPLPHVDWLRWSVDGVCAPHKRPLPLSCSVSLFLLGVSMGLCVLAVHQRRQVPSSRLGPILGKSSYLLLTFLVLLLVRIQ